MRSLITVTDSIILFPSEQLNPAKLEKGADTVVNLKQLLEFLFEAVEAIYKSIDESPG